MAEPFHPTEPFHPLPSPPNGVAIGCLSTMFVTVLLLCVAAVIYEVLQ